MTLKDLNRRHLWLISSYSARHALRGGTGIVFLFLVIACGLSAANAIVTPLETHLAKIEYEGGTVSQDNMEGILKMARWLVERVAGESVTEAGDHTAEKHRENKIKAKEAQAWSQHLIDEHPAVLSAIILFLLFSVPFLVAIGAFNQFSGDVQSRGIRFLLLRTERANLFFGRFIGVTVNTLITILLLFLIIVVYLSCKLSLYSVGSLVGWGFYGFFVVALVTIPYIALCSWISSAIDSPFGSLAICNVVIGGLPLVAFIAGNIWKPGGYIMHALPWGSQLHLLHPAASHVCGAGAACLGYTLFFLFLGYRNFMKRDL